MLKNKQCYRKCPTCLKSIKAIGQYEGFNLVGFIKSKCQFCGFKSNEFQAADIIMNNTGKFVKLDYNPRKPKTVDNLSN